MTVNAATLALVKEYEGFVNHAYPDPVSGGDPWTIGYGHTSAGGPPAVTKGMTVTKAEAEAILASDLAAVEAKVRALIKVPVNENQVGACVSLAFNVGVGAFASSTLLKKLNAGGYDGAAQEFARWNHAGGKVIAGLTRRRAAEAGLFNTPDTASPAPQAPSAPPPVSTTGWLAAIVNLFFAIIKGLRK